MSVDIIINLKMPMKNTCQIFLCCNFYVFLGWAATPAVQSSMPDFYEKLGDKWRSVEQVRDP